MIKIILSVLIITGTSYGAGYFKTDVTVNPERLIKLNMPISEANSRAAANDILNYSGKKGDILILINSGGGSVYSGELVIDSILAAQNKKIKIICLVSGSAMSMAFNIFIYCDKRVVFKHSKLMFHPVRLSFPLLADINGMRCVPLTSKQFFKYSISLDRIDERYVGKIAEVTGIPIEDVWTYYNEERYFTGRELQKLSRKPWLYIINKLNGITGVF